MKKFAQFVDVLDRIVTDRGQMQDKQGLPCRERRREKLTEANEWNEGGWERGNLLVHFLSRRAFAIQPRRKHSPSIRTALLVPFVSFC